MVGAILKFDKWSNNIFKILFKNIDVSLWCFNIQYWESYENNSSFLKFNEMNNISSELAKSELIYKNLEVYPEFAELFIGTTNIANSIKTYLDFSLSNYFLSIVIIDHRNIEICCKKNKLLNTIITNFERSNLENKRIIKLKSINPYAELTAYRTKTAINIFD